jgi:hypothetical protein
VTRKRGYFTLGCIKFPPGENFIFTPELNWFNLAFNQRSISSYAIHTCNTHNVGSRTIRVELLADADSAHA